jgi:hypothetical protein
MTLLPMAFTLARSVLQLVGVILLATATLSAAAPEPRGGRVGWARLIVPGSGWDLHSNNDPAFAEFIRTQTSLNIDPVWYSVDPGSMDKLCAYPFIYVKDVTRVSSEHDLGNIREYVRRGGFIFVDPCTTRFTETDTKRFQENHATLFRRLFPTCTVRELPDSHELYRCYFTVAVGDIITPDMTRLGVTLPPGIGLQGVFEGDRLIAVISTSGLECGWPQTPQRKPGCMQLIVNTYVYAMTR